MGWRFVLLALVAGAASCSGDGDVTVRTDDPPERRTEDAERLAQANAFAASGTSYDAASASVAFEVEYFEALRKADWHAPDHCWFSTRVTIGGTGAEASKSVAFDGPSADDDRDRGEGLVVGSVRSEVWALRASPGMAEPVPVPVPAVNLVAAVFGHDQVAELTTDHPAALGDQPASTQPVDGWSPLTLSLDAAAALPSSVPVTLRRLHADGREEVEDLSIHLDDPELELLTPEWEFDIRSVDDECRPPDGEVQNAEAALPQDLLGAPIGDAPRLPEPGGQPDDAATAATEALASIRAVYDLDDPYAESKKDHVEDPTAYLEIRRHLVANDVVAPYLSNLDPEFRSVVFVSPSEAHLLYRVGAGYQWEIGRVLHIDGRWRVAAGTLCRDLAAAGYTCPGVALDAPPGPLG